MQVRENLIKLCEKINDGHYKITPDCAEYRVFEKWITDEQISVMLALTSMKPAFVPVIARKAGLSVKRAREVLHEITEIGLVVQVIVPKVGLEIYLLPPYTPGIFEFLLVNEKFCLAHPEIAYAFHQHATTSQIEHAPNTPMGAGIMRVIPIESAIPADAQKIDNERCDKYIEDNDGHMSITPCQCRRVRRLMGEGAGDLDEGADPEMRRARLRPPDHHAAPGRDLRYLQLHARKLPRARRDAVLQHPGHVQEQLCGRDRPGQVCGLRPVHRPLRQQRHPDGAEALRHHADRA